MTFWMISLLQAVAIYALGVAYDRAPDPILIVLACLDSALLVVRCFIRFG